MATGSIIDKVAVEWEGRFEETAKACFEWEKRRLLAVLNEAREKSYQQKATVNWNTVTEEVQKALLESAEKNWRSQFIPVVTGLVEEQGASLNAAFGMRFDVHAIASEEWYNDYVMPFASGLIDSSQDELSGLLQLGMHEGWSIPKMEKHFTELYDAWEGEVGWSYFCERARRQFERGDITQREWDWYSGARRNRAEMIARSETIRASNRGANALYQGWGCQQKEWLTASDGRVCDFCLPMNGTVIAINGNFFEKGDTMTVKVEDRVLTMHFDYEDVKTPPLHPSCRCCLLPVIPDELTPEEAIIGRDMTEVVQESLFGGVNVYDDRSRVKHALVTALSESSGVPYETVNKFVRQWTETSNDTDMRALAIQRDAAELFGRELSEWQKQQIAKLLTRREELIQTLISSGRSREWAESYTITTGVYDPLYKPGPQKDILQAMHDNTQKWFESAGLGENDWVTLYRGFGLDERMQNDKGRFARKGDMIPQRGNALESWSTERDTAMDFMGDKEVGYVVQAEIPVKDILATCRTGFGCLREYEFVVFGDVVRDIKVIKERWVGEW